MRRTLMDYFTIVLRNRLLQGADFLIFDNYEV